MKSFCQWLILSCLAFGCVPLALARPAVLDTPAIEGGAPERSVILGLTRAGQRLVAVGERGLVLLSDDDGASWRQARVPVSVSLTAAQFVDARQGWAVGHLGVVLHSDDGGETWQRQLDGEQAAQLALQAAQASADPRLIDEAQRLVDDGPDKPFLDLYFRNPREGFVVGAYNLIYRTEDGGRSWQPWMSHLDNPSGLHLYAIRAQGDDLFIAGERGLLLRSQDAGASFQALASPYEGSFFGLLAGPQQSLLAFGLRGNAWLSRDRGQHWQALQSDQQASLAAGLLLADGSQLLVSQEGELLRVDSGALQPIGRLPGGAIASLLQSANGDLIGAGPGGLRRFPNRPAEAGVQSQ